MKSALLLTLLVIVALLAVPFSSASTIHATIDTSTNVGTVDATSNYVLFYTYPANSSISQRLNGSLIWFNATSYLNTSGRQSLQQNMDDNQNENSNANQNTPVVHVLNATMKIQEHAFANQTNLTVFRNLTIDLKITNITKNVGNNTTVIDMSWRAFRVQGILMSDFRGKMELRDPHHGINTQSTVNTNLDVNILGDLSLGGNENEYQMGGAPMGNLLSMGDFGTHVMDYNTIDFSVFSVPLKQWTKVYDSSADSTTFYYNTTDNISLNASMSVNGGNYSIKLMTDPSAAITTNGNATPTSANELTVSTKLSSSVNSGEKELIIGVVVAVLIVGLAVGLVRKKASNR